MSKMTLPSYPDDSHLHCNLINSNSIRNIRDVGDVRQVGDMGYVRDVGDFDNTWKYVTIS